LKGGGGALQIAEIAMLVLGHHTIFNGSLKILQLLASYLPYILLSYLDA
jgi:hypothetical protein